MREVIKQAATVDEAIELALRELSLTREQVSCEVLEYPEKRFFFKKPAKVKVVEIEEEFSVKDLFEEPKPAAKKEEPKTSEISIDDFAKVEMKIGEIIESNPVEGADKLLVSKIKIGDEVRQIVSGIAKYYNPADLIGRKVVVVTNLKPVKLRGVLSEGMILAASDGKDLSLITPDKDLESGSGVR